MNETEVTDEARELADKMAALNDKAKAL